MSRQLSRTWRRCRLLYQFYPKDIFSASQSRFSRNRRAGAYFCLFGLQLQWNWLLVLFRSFFYIAVGHLRFLYWFPYWSWQPILPRLTHGWPQIEDEFRTLWVVPHLDVSPPGMLYSGPCGWCSFRKLPSFLSKKICLGVSVFRLWFRLSVRWCRVLFV